MKLALANVKNIYFFNTKKQCKLADRKRTEATNSQENGKIFKEITSKKFKTKSGMFY